MIATSIIIGVALLWLAYETDYMRVRLLVGKLAVVYERKSWGELKPWIITKHHPFWLRHPDNMSPLCGLAWLENTMHVIPEYKIELNTGGVHYKMNIKTHSILKEVMKANRLTKAQRLAYA